MAGNSKHVCKKCKQYISKSVYKLMCSGKCKSYLHVECAELSEFEVRLMHKEKRTWFCMDCQSKVNECQKIQKSKANLERPQVSNQNSSPAKQTEVDLGVLYEEVKQLREDIKTFQTSMDFINSKYEDERKKNQVFVEMLQDMKKENQMLKTELQLVKEYVNKEENVKREQNLLLVGLCNNGKESETEIKSKIMKVMRTLKSELVEEDIIELNKIHTKNNKSLLIKIKLNSIEKKKEILSKRKKTGKLTTASCGIDDHETALFINEDMSTENYKLFKRALSLKFNGYKYVWYKNGRIYVRKTDNELAKRISREEQIEELLEEDTDNTL